MNIASKLSKLFNLEKITVLLNKIGLGYDELVKQLLEKNGGEILIRRQINDYFTFNINDKEKEIVILKSGKEFYTINCTCRNFQANETCQHVAAVLVSLKKQIEGELNNPIDFDKPLRLNAVLNTRKVDSSVYIIPDASIVSFQKLSGIFPFLNTLTIPKNIASRKINHGKEVSYRHKNGDFSVRFVVNDENNLEINCSCNKTFDLNLCEHASIAIGYIAYQFQPDQFISFLNRDTEKNRMLSEYGLNLTDSESKDFEFGIDYYGKLAFKKIPDHFIGLKDINIFKTKISVDSLNKIKKQKVFVDNCEEKDIGLVFIFSHNKSENNPIKIDAFKNEISKKGTSKITRLQLSNEENLNVLSNLSEEKFIALLDFSFIKFKDIISMDTSYSLNFNNFQQKYNEKTQKSYLNYFFNKLHEHWEVLSNWHDIKLLPEGESFHQSNLEKIVLSPAKLSLELKVSHNEKFIILEILYYCNGDQIETINKDVNIYFGKVIKIDQTVYLHEKYDFIPLLETMGKGKLFFPYVHKKIVMKNVLLPLLMKYEINLPEDLSIEIKEADMTPAVHFREFQDKFLLIEPKFYYDDLIFDKINNDDIFIEENNKTIYIKRDFERENEMLSYIKTLHPGFRNQSFSPYFQLPFDEVMKNHWFVSASKQMMEKGIKLVGVKELTRFKYSTATPVWNMNISSGIDWFDINVSANWGEEKVGYRDIKKAILNGQSFVVLGDGSFGVIPEDWIKKYSFLLKIAKDNHSGNLQISKKHFGIVDLLFDQIDDETVLAEIEAKKTQLLNIGKIETVSIPKEITATLRPYQESGYQWMQVLDDISWGGCLADDMGLGKTLQAITFLVYLKNKYNNPTSLIICPTSLIYNWENELKKFGPTLKYHIFYGIGRTINNTLFNDFDIIITSYGTARNDIESLLALTWEYIILDESQAIKNPEASTTKAMSLLKSRNKLILSGTPLQNNTFDLFAQFNFLNPGLLGSREFFRNEFANPIDKNNDKEASQTLRAMIKPFMLRRTKSEVAIDLPEKTETILWCEMDKEQKAMYDEYKDYYRNSLTQKIEADGLAKSGIYILEGLLRLRQICDDPRLIKDKDRPPIKGVKIQELIREIIENTGDHKMLIFSQFTEMLALIRTELDENEIQYCYLDGSTPAMARKNEVDSFQNNPDIKVFLISLKAGGVGLNLTEADYVYIVDPWWNPAVEQQAIDRTHRIGQKNNIFAYKMICKDSVEEKILLLQEKKLGISKELISEDGALFKKLTKDDIQFLFS